VNKGLLSPRGRGPAPVDLGERSAFIARQRVGRAAARGRRARPVRRRWWRRLGMGTALLMVFALQVLAVRWVLTAPRFAITAIEVRGASRVSAERILAVAAIAPGTNLWRLNPDAVMARVATLPEIRRADVVRELPNRVTIVVEERRPFTLVHAGQLHWLDEDGRLMGEESQAVAPPVPVITGLTDEELTSMRTAPTPKALAAIALIRALLRTRGALAAEISEIDMSRREGPVLYTVDGIEVRLGAEDWEERLARLEGVLAQVATREEAVSTIDLRFRDQVVLKKGGQG
jgi:cell division protein FtsQ